MNDPRFDKEPNYKTDYISVPVYDEDGKELSHETVYFEYYETDTDVVITNHSLIHADKGDFKLALLDQFRNKYIDL